ncbi:antirestriction protein [Pantoea cypripedii]|nr:antirestriction protein [Pantoea cypripedii]
MPSVFAAGYQKRKDVAARLTHAACGGEEEFVRPAAGGGFMQPPGERWRFQNPANWSDEVVSAEAAGIIITALVLNHRSWMHSHHDAHELCSAFCHRYDQLVKFANRHPEAVAIFRALGWQKAGPGGPVAGLRPGVNPWQAVPADEAECRACSAAGRLHLSFLVWVFPLQKLQVAR